MDGLVGHQHAHQCMQTDAQITADRVSILNSRGWWGISLALAVLLGAAMPVVAQDSGNVLQAFEAQAEKKAQNGDVRTIVTKRKHQILFIMGFSLLIGVLTTVGLGIAMGVYGKPVFVAHMVAAGLTATLAIIHAIVAMVWFFPF